MTNTKEIRKTFESLPAEKQVELWNEYCEVNNQDAIIRPLNEETFNEVMGNYAPWQVAGFLPANPDQFNIDYDDWFVFDCYLRSAKQPTDIMDDLGFFEDFLPKKL